MFVGIAKKHCNITHILLAYKVHQELKDLLVKIVIGKNVCKFVGLMTTFGLHLWKIYLFVEF